MNLALSYFAASYIYVPSRRY